MKITIITPSFNRASTLGQTIESVRRQDHDDVEHIVVDGGSTDGTLKLLAERCDERLRYLSEPDQGPYDAMNKGIAIASGEIIGILNSDDFYVDSTVLNQVANAFKDPNVMACYADLVYVDPIDQDVIVRYWTSQPFKPGLFQKGWMPAHPTFFVRSEVYRRLGGFDLSFGLAADFELTLRFLAANTVQSKYIPKTWVKMRTGGLSNSSVLNILRSNLQDYRACRLHRLKVAPFAVFVLLKIASKIVQLFKRPGRPDWPKKAPRGGQSRSCPEDKPEPASLRDDQD